MKGKNGALLYIPVWFTLLIIPTGKLIFYFFLSHESYFWPGQGIFSKHNDDGKITGQALFSKMSFHAFV